MAQEKNNRHSPAHSQAHSSTRYKPLSSFGIFLAYAVNAVYSAAVPLGLAGRGHLLIWHLSRFVAKGNSITAALRYIHSSLYTQIYNIRNAPLSSINRKVFCESHYRNVFMNQMLAVNAGRSGSISIARYDTSSELAYFIIRHRYPFPCFHIACVLRVRVQYGKCFTSGKYRKATTTTTTKHNQKHKQLFKCYTLLALDHGEGERLEACAMGLGWRCKKFSFHFARHLRRRRLKLLQCYSQGNTLQ